LCRDFPALFDVVADERFVTARHALQAMWKVGLRKLFDAVQDETIQVRAKALIELESDAKYKKKYSTLWPKT
jgi:hypothetical protein